MRPSLLWHCPVSCPGWRGHCERNCAFSLHRDGPLIAKALSGTGTYHLGNADVDIRRRSFLVRRSLTCVYGHSAALVAEPPFALRQVVLYDISPASVQHAQCLVFRMSDFCVANV